MEADAWYEDDEITICYEYVYELWTNMLKETTLSGVAPIDTVIGPLLEASLHEFAHVKSLDIHISERHGCPELNEQN